MDTRNPDEGTPEWMRVNRPGEPDLCTYCAGVGEVEVDDEEGNAAYIECDCCSGTGLQRYNTCYGF